MHVETGERTIAVLTFTNVTGDAADDWIGTGIAETVTADLKNVHDVTVIGRAQVFEQLKNANAETGRSGDSLAIEIGRRLGAWWVVSGAYQRIGERIRITAQLVEVLNGRLLRTVKIDGRVERHLRAAGPHRLRSESQPERQAREGGSRRDRARRDDIGRGVRGVFDAAS